MCNISNIMFCLNELMIAIKFSNDMIYKLFSYKSLLEIILSVLFCVHTFHSRFMITAFLYLFTIQ
jgi:hypothetical protein